MINNLRARLRCVVRDERGFSLFDLIVGTTLMLAMSGSVYPLVGTGGRSLRHIGDSVQTQSQLRAAIDSLTDESRWGTTITAETATSVTVRVAAGSPFSPTSDYTVTFAYDAAADRITREVDPDAEGPTAAGTATVSVTPMGGISTAAP